MDVSSIIMTMNFHLNIHKPTLNIEIPTFSMTLMDMDHMSPRYNFHHRANPLNPHPMTCDPLMVDYDYISYQHIGFLKHVFHSK